MHRTAAITAVEDRPQAGRKTASSSSSDSDELVAQILPSSQKSQSRSKAPIWRSNAIFFVSMHLLGLYGAVYISPWSTLDSRTMWMAVVSWQLAIYGITAGYHRLWSHAAYEASTPLRIALAGMGCLGFQGSIKWWVLRHRLHHRWTDSEDDPYDASLGLWHTHCGWIFRKPRYAKMHLISQKDLNDDPVVRFQHKHYLPLTLFLGFVLPTALGSLYGDAMGAYIWAGVIARLAIWHVTFMINSLAHYIGEQEYTTELTARGNFFLAMLTGGEGNHNYHHAFPKDYRNGVALLDWDPTKWLLYILHHLTPFVTVLHTTPPEEIDAAQAHVLKLETNHLQVPKDEELPVWSKSEVPKHVRELTHRAMAAGSLKRPMVLLLDGYAVDAGSYSSTHPGGIAVFRAFAIDGEASWKAIKDSSKAFNGGYNNHGFVATEKMKTLRIAKVL